MVCIQRINGLLARPEAFASQLVLFQLVVLVCGKFKQENTLKLACGTCEEFAISDHQSRGCYRKKGSDVEIQGRDNFADKEGYNEYEI